MSARPKGTLLKSSQHHDRTNLQLAREICANEQGYIPIVVTWAKRVIQRLDSSEDNSTGQGSQGSFAFDATTELRRQQ